jgi:hypothetical protein
MQRKKKGLQKRNVRFAATAHGNKTETEKKERSCAKIRELIERPKK